MPNFQDDKQKSIDDLKVQLANQHLTTVDRELYESLKVDNTNCKVEMVSSKIKIHK